MEKTPMQHRRSTTIITRRSGITKAAGLCLALLLAAALMLAHEGFDHVTGTIAKLDGNTLTVKTAKGNVDVKLDSKTEISRNNQKAAMADLKPGTRVVVDIPEDSKDKIAHSVKLGAAAATASH